MKKKSEVRKSEGGVSNAEVRKKSKVGGPKSEEEKTSAFGIPHSEIIKSEIENNTSAPDSYRDDIPHSEIKELPTANSTLQTETMEVHHHPEVEKKTFKQYLLEGLMIFIAVMMGYFAESLREKLTDSEKEKQAIESLVKCLASDTAQLKSIIQSNNLLAQNLDSLIMLKNADLTNEKNKGRFYEHGTIGFFEDWYFKTNDAAMQQIKSSGILRLIKKQNIIDKIFGYELKNKVTIAQEADTYFFYKESLLDYKKVADLSHLRDTSIVNYNITNNFLFFHYKKVNQLPINGNKEKLNAVFNNAALMAIALESYVQYMKEQSDYGKSLILLLKKEYHLEDE